MDEPKKVLTKIEPFIEDYFENRSIKFDEDNPTVRLVDSPYESDEVIEAIESMLSTFVSKGEKVEKFEEKWSNYVNASTGVMTNSGSSANLLALKALEEDFSENAEIIVPAVGWSTTYFPIKDIDAKPVYVDVDPETLTINLKSVRSAINEDTEAVMVVHLLGSPAPVKKLQKLCRENDLKLIEDCAEAHGAEVEGQKVGAFGDIGTFSFSFSHHVTTMEGGIAVTDSTELESRMRKLLSWGRDYENHESGMEFSFVKHGYNLRPTEVQAAFGIHQVERMEEFVEERRENARYLNKKLSDLPIKTLEERSGVRNSYLHYPMIIEPKIDKDRKEFREYLDDNGIENRAIVSGKITEHPAFEDFGREHESLKGAELLHEKGVYVSCHPYLEQEHLDHIVETVKSFFN